MSHQTRWWLNQPIWKICSSNWMISPGIAVKIENIWNHHWSWANHNDSPTWNYQINSPTNFRFPKKNNFSGAQKSKKLELVVNISGQIFPIIPKLELFQATHLGGFPLPSPPFGGDNSPASNFVNITAQHLCKTWVPQKWHSAHTSSPDSQKWTALFFHCIFFGGGSVREGACFFS